ncbi:MAG: hypothetical protein Q4G70_10525 [Pseudomonadota bacterium]|nr:hypothetical protein [Pseudomonadota bacterium]
MKYLRQRGTLGAALLTATWLSTGCAVASATAGAAISVTGAVVSTGVSLTGKAIGAGIDAMSSKPEQPDNSGIVIHERIEPAPEAAPHCPPRTDDAANADPAMRCRQPDSATAG